MPQLIPPAPNGALPGSTFWNDWCEKLRTTINALSNSFSWNLITGTPTTFSGYGISPLITTDDFIVDDENNGVILKSPDGHYWRISVNNGGNLFTTDLGLTLP